MAEQKLEATETSTEMSVKALVLVTGATGFIAGHIIKVLLESGYHVRGTVRKLTDKHRYDYLYRFIPNNDESKLQFIQTDLCKPDNWKEAVLGCRYVIHTATPIPLMDNPSLDDTYSTPILSGMKFILEACARANSAVEKLVYTSSSFSTLETYPSDNSRVITVNGDQWRDINQVNHPYEKAKAKAERLGWQFIKENNSKQHMNRFEFVAINPAIVIGPVLKPEKAGSNDVVALLMTGDIAMAPNAASLLVDVREVATAHVNALAANNAGGNRYLLMAQSLTYPQISVMLREKYEKMGYTDVTTSVVPNWLLRLIYGQNATMQHAVIPYLSLLVFCDNTPSVRDLGVEYRPLPESIYDTADSLIEFGFIPKPNPHRKPILKVVTIGLTVATLSLGVVMFNKYKPHWTNKVHNLF